MEPISVLLLFPLGLLIAYVVINKKGWRTNRLLKERAGLEAQQSMLSATPNGKSQYLVNLRAIGEITEELRQLDYKELT